jgi:hypothetical protein
VDDSGSSPVGRGLEFEQFVLEILKRSPDFEPPVTVSSYGRDLGFDMAASRDGRTLLIEAMVITPQTTVRLREAIAQLEAGANQYVQSHDDADPELILAFPGALSHKKWAMAHDSALTVWDGSRLRSMAEPLGISVPAYVAPVTTAQWPDSDTAYAHALIERLDTISPGKADWPAYERYCEDLLNFLFTPPLNTAIPQSRDERHINRRDFVLPNYAMERGFWQFMRSHYEAHYVVAEVKNLRKGPGKREILQVANYLNPRGTGLFAIVLAREELTSTGRWICREQWVQHSKLIVGLNDDDVRQMLWTRVAHGDPAELIRQRIEDFRLKI